MTAEELRELANAIEPMACAPRFDSLDMPALTAFLRACADAMDAGPVAWRIRIPGESELGHWFGEVPLGEGYTNEALYPVAMPAQAQALRLPEPMADGEMLDVLIEASRAMAVNDGYDPDSLKLDHEAVGDGLTAGRTIESAILRRVKEANNG